MLQCMENLALFSTVEILLAISQGKGLWSHGVKRLGNYADFTNFDFSDLVTLTQRWA